MSNEVRHPDGVAPNDPDGWKADLVVAGWRELSLHVWESPDGRQFRGPFGAWYRMKQEQRYQAFMERHRGKA